MTSERIDTRRRARIFWKDNQTGSSGVYTDTRECPSMYATGDEDGFSIFWWAAGNGACDCNRIPFFLNIGDAECGDDRFTIEKLEVLEADDRVIQTFDASYFAEVSR